MAAGTVLQGRRDDFNQLVRGWDRRLRVQQLLTWLPRALLPGLLIGIALALISRTRPWLLSGQILLISAVLLFFSIVIMLLVVWLRPRPSLMTARRLDVQLGLQERVSTALELIEGRIQANESLAALQIDDAWTQARTVQISAAVPLVWRRRDWITVLAAGLALALLLVLPNPQEAEIARDVAQEAAIDAAADELREITEDIASNSSLEQADREELLQALETSQTVLNEPGVTPEEAFATLADAQSTLQEKSDALNQQAVAQQSALQEASEALRNATSGDQQPPDQSTSAQGASQSLDQLSDEIPTMDSAAQQQAADALEAAADSLEATNPQAAQDMRDAAESLRQGDSSAAQESLQQASSDLQNAEQSAQEQSASSQQLQESAQSAGEAADQVRQQSDPSSQQGQPPPGNEGEQSPSEQGQSGQQGEQQQGQQGQPDQQSPSDSNQQGEEGGQPQSGQSGQEGQQGEQSGQPGDQPGQEGQPGENGQPSDQNSAGGNQQGQGSPGEGLQGAQPGDSPSDAPGAGAGDAPGGAGSDQSLLQQGATGGEVQQDNNPDGQGEGQFDPVYAPQRIGGESDQNINLEPDGSDAPLQQGEFTQNPTGNSTVPYDQVFSDYSNAANQALESDYIPLGLRDVVRNYFSSLEPGQGGGTQR